MSEKWYLCEYTKNRIAFFLMKSRISALSKKNSMIYRLTLLLIRDVIDANWNLRLRFALFSLLFKLKVEHTEFFGSNAMLNVIVNTKFNSWTITSFDKLIRCLRFQPRFKIAIAMYAMLQFVIQKCFSDRLHDVNRRWMEARWKGIVLESW